LATYKIETEYERMSRGTGMIRRVDPEQFYVWITDEAVERHLPKMAQKYSDREITREDVEHDLAQKKLAVADSLGLLDSDDSGDGENYAPRGTACSACGRQHVMCRKAEDLVATATTVMGFPLGGFKAYCDDCRSSMFKKCGGCHREIGSEDGEFCWVCKDEDLRPFRFAKIRGNPEDPVRNVLTKMVLTGEGRGAGMAAFLLPPDHPNYGNTGGWVDMKAVMERAKTEGTRVKKTYGRT
jgi:hypothetical protein